jgi:hypothetical protein
MLRSVVSLIAPMMEAVNTSETSVSLNETTRCNTPEDSHLQECVVFTFTPSYAFMSGT